MPINFAPEFFTNRGYPLAYGSWIASSLAAADADDCRRRACQRKTGRPVLSIGIELVATIVAASALLFVSFPTAHFVLIALLAGLPVGPIMLLPRQNSGLGPCYGNGNIFVCYHSAMAAVPELAGKLPDLTGSPLRPYPSVETIVCSLLFLIAFHVPLQPSNVLTQPRFA